MRQICYDLCLYKLIVPQEHIFDMMSVLKNELVNIFNIKPSGIGYSGQRKIKKYSETSFIKLSDDKTLNSVTIYFGGTSGVNDEWSILLEFHKNCLSLVIDQECVNNITVNLWVKLYNKTFGNKNFDMGFICKMPFKNSPECYNHGTIGNDWSKEDEEKIWSWSMNYNRPDGQYKPGDLRDVYPYNIISDLHLNRDVHGQTLESWIKSDPSHGTLEKISDTHWLWTVEDQHIPQAQEVLSSAHLLVAYWEKY